MVNIVGIFIIYLNNYIIYPMYFLVSFQASHSEGCVGVWPPADDGRRTETLGVDRDAESHPLLYLKERCYILHRDSMIYTSTKGWT